MNQGVSVAKTNISSLFISSIQIWTPYPRLIPQDPQPFPAPQRKPHALCITIQAYFRAEKQKIEMQRASLAPAISPTVSYVSLVNEVLFLPCGVTKRDT